MRRQKDLLTSRNPIRLLTTSVLLTASAITGLSWLSYQSHGRYGESQERAFQIEQLRGRIVHLDEVLTMSARMGVATGDPAWEERYRRFEPQLDAAIKKAVHLVPDAYSGEAAAQIDAANSHLVSMENRAFELMRQGRINEARTLLFSDEYEKQKQIYAEGMQKFSSALRNQSVAGLTSRQLAARWSVGTGVSVLGVLLAAWIAVLRTMRRWQVALLEQNLNLDRRSKALAELNATLDAKVEERTSELASSRAKALKLMKKAEADRQRAVEAREALREREEHTRLIIDTAFDAVISMDSDGQITMWNRQAEATFGWKQEEVLGLPLSSTLVPPRLRPAHEQGLQRFRETGEERMLNRRIEVAAIRRDGEELPVELAITPVRTDDRVFFHAFLRDITDRKRSERELAEARDQALEASRLKSEFLANMSHEIRTPMNGVMGMAGLLLETPLTSEQNEYARTIYRCAEALLSLINDILDFSKIEAGKLTIEPVSCDLRQTVEEVVELLAPRAKEKGLDLRLGYPPETPRHVVADPGRIRQVLTNLAGNAIKFTEQGYVLIETECISRSEDEACIRLTVRDTGIGIPENKLPHLFEAFTQADASTTRKYGGTGLGLAITRQLSELMGGSVEASSRPGEGSAFSVTLPFKLDRNLDRPRSVGRLSISDKGAAEAPGSPTEAHVLVVDDNFVNQRVAVRMLEKLGCRADVATNGQEAVRRVNTLPYDLVLMDCQMPGMDGYEATREIRRQGGLHKLPIVAMTASAMKGDREKCLQAGMDDYISKPVRPAELKSVLERWTALVPARRPTS